MKRVLTVLIVASLFSGTITAQDFRGIATYKLQRKLDVKLDSTQMESEMHQKMMDMLKKPFQKTYILSFSKEASVYKEDEQLEAPQPTGMVMVETGGYGVLVLYKNIKENRFTNQNESFGKLFLIKDELEKHDWELTGETKFIGDYKCYKATKKHEVAIVEEVIIVNEDEDLGNLEDEELKMKEVTVTAWYTPQIPVNNGPENYHGLPGLILEVNDGTTTIVCSKIVLNPDKKVTISEPKKGKEITQEKYEATMEKKMKEIMHERF